MAARSSKWIPPATATSDRSTNRRQRTLDDKPVLDLGGLAAAGVAALGAPLLLQVIVFAVVSALSVGAVRPIIIKHARTALESGETPFGVEAIEGSHALVLEEVDADRGMIKIDGEMWQARSFAGTEKYLPGERVRVIKLRGATAIVWRDDLPNI